METHREKIDQKLEGEALDKNTKLILLEAYQHLIINQWFPSLEKFIKEFLPIYSDQFVERLEKFALTEKGEPLKITNWVKEFASLVGDLRVPKVLTTGSAQTGKSLINTLLLCDFLIFVRLNVIWFYPSKQQVDLIVPEQFSKIIKYYLANVEQELASKLDTEVKLRTSDDRTLTSRYQIKGATAIFSYASTSGKDHTESKKGLATAGGSATSVSASLMFIDEKSQISPDAAAVLPRRLDASRLPIPYIREVGTPGSGLGIESSFEFLDKHFYPHVQCPSCNSVVQLSPKGCLLKPLDNGKYLNEFGRPERWHCYSKTDAINSAYIGCSACGEELPKETRVNAFFQCIKTGQTLKEYRNSLPNKLEDIVRNQDTIAIHLSPLVKDTAYNLASYIVKAGKENDSVRDYQQQLLGFPSETEAFGITYDMIKSAMKAETSTREPDAIIAGIDQGRASDWIVIMKIWIKGSYRNKANRLRLNTKEMPLIQIFEQSFREIIIAQPILRKHIPKYLNQYNVTYGFIDQEPDRGEIYHMCKDLHIYPADQRGELLNLIEERTVEGGGNDFPIYAIDNSFFQDAVLNSWKSKNLKCPQWDIADRSSYSPPKHLTNHTKDLILMKWTKGDGIDDIFFANVFAEAGFYRFLYEIAENQHKNIDWYDYV